MMSAMNAPFARASAMAAMSSGAAPCEWTAARSLKMLDVRDVEDADATDSLRAHRVLHTLAATVDASRVSFGGHEQQVLVNRDVALRGRAVVPDLQDRLSGIGDVPDLIAVVIALDDV